MFSCGDRCPYADYLKFYNYYGQFDYANQWILATFDRCRTIFSKGNVDFGAYEEMGDGIVAKQKCMLQSLLFLLYLTRLLSS